MTSSCLKQLLLALHHDDVINWKHLPRYWPFVRGIHRSPVNSPHKGQWRGALMFSLICIWINDWVNNLEAGDFRRHRGYNDVTVMTITYLLLVCWPHLLLWWQWIWRGGRSTCTRWSRENEARRCERQHCITNSIYQICDVFPHRNELNLGPVSI